MRKDAIVPAIAPSTSMTRFVVLVSARMRDILSRNAGRSVCFSAVKAAIRIDSGSVTC
jgi:hypothetical protein